MDNSITEKTFPIENKWVVKNIIITSFATLFFTTVFSIQTHLNFKLDGLNPSFILIMILPISVIVTGIIRIISFPLQKKNFHFLLGEDNFIIKQGIISKKETHVPYGTIQNIYIKQDLIDRLIGINAILIENASVGGGYVNDSRSQNNKYYDETQFLGVSGNKLSIYGLTIENAERLKQVIMQKMIENPIDDNKSGL